MHFNNALLVGLNSFFNIRCDESGTSPLSFDVIQPGDYFRRLFLSYDVKHVNNLNAELFEIEKLRTEHLKDSVA